MCSLRGKCSMPLHRHYYSECQVICQPYLCTYHFFKICSAVVELCVNVYLLSTYNMHT